MRLDQSSQFINPTSIAPKSIKVMVVDDSAVARAVLGSIIERELDFQLEHSALNSMDAIEYLSHNMVDIILLDIEMPQRSGIDALPDIIEKANGARILVVSSQADEEGPIAVKALSLGACDTLMKPGKTVLSGTFSKNLCEKVRSLGNLPKKNSKNILSTDPRIAATKVKSFYKIDEEPMAIFIGGSTGAIPPIIEFLRSIEGHVNAPIFLTQHLPSEFLSFFAKQLEHSLGRACKVAEDNEAVRDKMIYVAPGDKHLQFVKEGKRIDIKLTDHFEMTHYRPSVDAMLMSGANVYGADALAFIFSGMGRDGEIGAQSLIAARSKIIVQDYETSVIWGMPGTIARQNMAAAILNPMEMATSLNKAGQP
ncbi:hypothetical protein LPB140_07485 [Sphingorhabdus lutea]|uniref:protein-glutamate methylesterase n=1 Tax=Sphingorhabdus lutea TaxID=1913578 RepID=A0A1L3JBY8_9SPHN|nr:chemotaxis protein CheB [Sphingorhabdus lutea]APG62655.1 hypothetical protein LPB140_07485 [Sphingorhabdus lutea]